MTRATREALIGIFNTLRRAGWGGEEVRELKGLPTGGPDSLPPDKVSVETFDVPARTGPVPNLPPLVCYQLTLTPALDDLIDEVARHLGGTRGYAILRGIALLEIALKAKQEGKRLVVVDDRDGSEQEVNEV